MTAAVELTRDLAYLVAAILFVLAIKRLGSPRTARQANFLAALGMLVAVVATLLVTGTLSLTWVLGGMVVGGAIGAVLAVRIAMTEMPQLVAMFNGFGGIASGLVATAEFVRQPPGALHGIDVAIIAIGCLIGGITFTGSLIAFGKLQGLIPGRPIALPANEALVAVLLVAAVGAGGWLALAPDRGLLLVAVIAIALVLGNLLVLPIGGADMPVVVALLNSYSGLAAAATGFILDNKALIVSGALVGASGLILTSIMCKAMNRSLANVLFARVGTDDGGGAGTGVDQGAVKTMAADDVALLLDSARLVLIVPGYGLAVAQAQHAVRDLAAEIEKRGGRVVYAIHPVAGRMPGHMDVLLAEANIPYDNLLDLDQSNAEVERADVALVLGANDVVNPAARTETSSPIYGMPIIDVDKARTVLIVKRSMAAGYAGVQNPLFFLPNAAMVFGDAKKVLNEILAELRQV